MSRCEHCQTLLLDHLYGLLEGPEAVAVETHLRECTACAAAQDEAARMQGLFAQAAKSAFPSVRFDAPSPQTVVPGLPLAEPATSYPARTGQKTWRFSTVIPWAVAAAVLLAIPGTVIPVLGTLQRAQTARKDAEDSSAKLTALLSSVEQAQRAAREPREVALRDYQAKKQNHDLLVSRWMSEEKENLSAARKKTVDVLKPVAFQPGAPNEFLLVVHDHSSTPNDRLLAEVRDQTDAVIFSQPLEAQRQPGERQMFRLPVDMWTKVKPQSELFLVVASEDLKTGQKTKLQEPLRLLGPVFATMLVTDKPVYRPGETLYFRSLTLDRVSFRPPERDQFLEYELYEQRGPARIVHGKVAGGTDLVRVAGEQVTPVLGPDGKPVRGVGCGSFALPNTLQDGDYTLLLRELPHPAGYPPVIATPVTRSLKVRAGQVEVFEKRSGFNAASFAAGDMVEGWATVQSGATPLAGAEVRASVTADNFLLNEVTMQPSVTGPDGRVNFRFRLPQDLRKGDVRLKLFFSALSGKDVIQESLVERVPVIGRQVNVEFFPEGGDLVAGVPCRVFFRATTPTGQPVDIKGTITDGTRTLARVETVTDSTPGASRGMGSFTFVPVLGTPIWLKLDSPKEMYAPLLRPEEHNFPSATAAMMGIPAVSTLNSGFLLPKVLGEGVVMTIPDAVTVPGQPIRVHLRSVGKTRHLVVGAYTRGRMSDEPQRVRVEPGELAEVKLMAGTDPRGGVVRVTVFEETESEATTEPKLELKPVVERLVFRRPGESLNLNFTTSGTTTSAGGFAPGSPVDLTITAADEKGNPAAALLYAATVNSSVAPGAKDRLLTTHFLIAGEITTPDAMEYADFLLTDNPKAAEALDIVLATQGWRRFVEQTPKGYLSQPSATNRDRADLLVRNGQYGTWSDPVALREEHRLREVYRPRYEDALKAMNAAQAALAAVSEDRSHEKKLSELADEAARARQQERAYLAQAAAAAEPVERFTRAGWFGVAGFGLLAVMLGVVCLARPATRFPLGVGTAGALGLVGFLVIALGMAGNIQAAGKDRATGETSASSPAQPAASVDVALAPLAPESNQLALGATAAAASDMAMTKLDAPPPNRGVVADAMGGVVTNNAGRTTIQEFSPGVAPPVLPKVVPFPPSPSGMGGGGFGGGIPGGGKGGKGVNPGNPAGSGLAKGGLGATVPSPPKALFPSPAPASGGGPGGVAQTMVAPKGPVTQPEARWQPFAGRPPIVLEDPDRRVDRFSKRVEASERTTPAPTMMRGGAPDPSMGIKANAAQPETELAKRYVDARASEMASRIEQTVRQPRPVTITTPEGVVKQQGTAVSLSQIELAALSRIRGAIPSIPPLVVREYAAARPGDDISGAEPRDTILWQPIIVLPGEGKTRLSFNLGFAERSYQVLIAGHTLDGRIGAIRGFIPVMPQESRERIAAPALPNPVPPKAP